MHACLAREALVVQGSNGGERVRMRLQLHKGDLLADAQVVAQHAAGHHLAMPLRTWAQLSLVRCRALPQAS
jgi:hypothetical protein